MKNQLVSIFQRYFIVGSNNARTKYRILKIDRTEGHDLTIVDDRVEYTELDMINSLNIGLHRNTTLSKIASAFGIVGKDNTFFIFKIINLLILLHPFNIYVKVL